MDKNSTYIPPNLRRDSRPSTSWQGNGRHENGNENQPRLAAHMDRDRLNIPSHINRVQVRNGQREDWRRDDCPSTDRPGNGRQNGGENQGRPAGRSRPDRATNFGFRQNNGNRFTRNTNESTDEEFVNDLLNNKNIQEVANSISSTQRFVKIINSNPLEHLVVKLLKLVAQLCNSAVVSNKNYIIKVTMQETFVKRINSFLSLLVVNDDKDPEFWETFDHILNCITTILENALNLMPMSMWVHVKSVVKNLNIVLAALKNEKLVNILALTEEKVASLQRDIDKVEEMFKKPENPDNETENEILPNINYRFVSIYPEIAELITLDRPYVRKNIVDRPYASVAQYLDTHFRLIRGDFVNPIREDICDFLNKSNKRLFNIKIHWNIKFVERTLFKKSRCYKIQFNLPDWISKSLEKGEQLKRFIHGTLLLFSPDNFNTMLCGKVINSDELKKGCLVVEIPGGTPSFDDMYLMIECIVFFEPYYQVLTVLQHLNGRTLPMEDYIIKVSKETRPPKYMGNVHMIEKVPGLNQSQENALNAAMSKEFVIIQGPPGTGKTFLGMKIVGQILKLRAHWHYQGPILIICFTNHALDQFLVGLRKETDKIARLGGQSNLQDIENKYGPEATVRELYSDIIDSIDYGIDYESFIKSLKAGREKRAKHMFASEYRLINNIPEETKYWMKAKGRLNRMFFELKQVERVIKTKQQSIEHLDTLKHVGIFKTDFLFKSSVVYYYFADFELACWLLCDDGTIRTDLNTVQNVGLIQNYNNNDEPSKIYNLLSDCIIERDLEDSKSNFDVTVGMLKDYARELEEYFSQNRHDRGLQEYLNFLKQKIDYLTMCLRTDFDPPEVEVNNNINPWNLPSKSRWQLYNQWVRNRKQNMMRLIEIDMLNYQQQFDAYNMLREEDNIKLLRKMDIVGMTTTCAARMRSTLEVLRCPIVVVEEAAEVLESHIVTALTNNCQHLILLGDHQQLRPTTSDYTIEKKYKLGISLFERMVNNNVQCHTLNVQHRMRPEISKLLKPTFYKDLEDSESVKLYPTVTGVKGPLFFIDHTEPEEPYGDSSKMNVHEAKFIIQLAIYLLNNDYSPTEITILAAYLGQTYILKEERNKSAHPLIHDVHITPVDNFQGEENKIILLSLVRSNTDNKIGFLKVDNRVCVALSRAKEGFYVMGNMTQLCASSEIWKPIKASLESQNAIGRHLSLCCRNHTEYVTLASKPSDFQNVPEGGCNIQCNKRLICSHHCKRKCHGYDLDHDSYECKEPCKKSICDISEHKCKKRCHELCGLCYYPVKKLLLCGHEKTVKCHLDIQSVECEVMIEVEHDCKHIQSVPCYKNNHILNCMIEVEKELPCAHQGMIPCSADPSGFECTFSVEVEIACGHTISKKCHQETKDVICGIKCEEILKCGHACRLKCHKHKDPGHLKYECLEPCSKNKLGCHHPDTHPKCNLPCGKRCQPCTVMALSSENCSHLNKIECYKKQENNRCKKKCNKKLSCGHTCPNQCFESCEHFCSQKTFKVIPECGHKIKISCNGTPDHSLCKQQCSKSLPCGHSCNNLCGNECTKQCNKKCTKVLECKHDCIKLCYEPCACKTEKYPECDHVKAIKCGDILRQEDCQRPRCNK